MVESGKTNMPPLRRLSFGLLAAVLLPSCSHLAAQRQARQRPAIERAAAAWQSIAAGIRTSQVVADYDLAVAQVVEELSSQHTPDRWPATFTLAEGRTLKVDPGSLRNHEAWPPTLFDALHHRRKAASSPVTQALRPGLGAPLDGVREHHVSDADSRFVYSKGQHLPVTALIEFGPSPAAATLHLYDPREVRAVRVGRQRMALAADFALPVEPVLERRFFLVSMLTGLFRPERFQINQGLYLQEPYRPDKVPVVFVHGLMSDPHIWENEVLSLMSDPEIGPRVQCWWFTYPTGLPVAMSALRLRTSMAAARRTFDPAGRDPGMKSTFMVGHSMGGLLTRMQVQDSGEDYWHAWFRAEPEDLPLDGETSHLLHDALIFKADRSIKNVVFIATPHRGSNLASSWLAVLGSKLIQAPSQIVQLATSVATLDAELLNPERRSFASFGLNSIGSLSPGHPLFTALNARPMTAPCHSIIGNLGSSRPLWHTTDGAVPYASSHLDEARSETILPCWHGCVEHLECAQEVTRLVREHLHDRN